MKQELYISPKSILYTFGTLIILLILWQIKEILFLIFIVFLLFAAFNPLVNWLEKISIPRILSVIIIYIGFLSLLTLISYIIIPPIIQEIQSLSNFLPSYFSHLKTIIDKTQSSALNAHLQSLITTFAQGLSKFSEGAWAGIVSIFGGFISFLVIVVASFYLLLFKNDFHKKIEALVPKKYQEVFNHIIQKSIEKLGHWTLGEIILCVIIGILYFIVLSILNVKFALVLATLGGILEIVPTIGPIISAIPAIAIAFLDSPLKAFIVLVAFVLIQQLENHFFVPIIMKRAINLNPVFTIFALLVGAKLGGILGAIIAVPMLAVLFVIWEESLKAYENSRAQ